ncbi:MAG: translation elongation factor Ts [Oscillospiraceae bacterium]|nr:translation elongation factor Ts [Oscillospiraceae bacterium]
MPAFTAKDISTLRQMTGAGMMDCKAALTEADGDIEKAVLTLREKGLAAVAKKAGRIAADGMVHAAVADNGVAGIVEVNSETDFVAKNEDFQTFVKDLVQVVINENPADLDALGSCKYPNSDLTVAQVLQDKVLVIGENIKIRRFARFGEPYNVSYVHMGGRIGVLTHMEVDSALNGNPAVRELAYDICMQVAAMRPICLDRSQLDAAALETERTVYLNQAKAEGKPDNVAEKMVEGRLRKYYSEVCLMEQAFFKDEELTIARLVEQKAKELGGSIKLTAYYRFEKGEGLEKREDNLADEVAKMVGK